MYTSRQDMSGLTQLYDFRAASIIQGHGILIPDDWRPSNTGLLSFAPGYSIYLSAIYALWGRNFFTVQLIQNATNSITPVLVFLIASILISWRVGALAGLLTAASHHLSHYSNLILPDSLSTLPIVAGVYFLAKAWKTNTEGDETNGLRIYLFYALSGIMLGISAWIRPNAMMLAPFVLAMLVAISARRWQAIKYGAVMLMATVVTISPITIRNYVIYGEFVPISINLGIVLWQGIGDAGGERFGAVRTDEAVEKQEIIIYNDPRYNWWASPDGIERDRDRIKKSLGVIVRNPIWYSGAMYDRIGQMLKYSAHAPLVFRTTDRKLADELGDAPLTYLPDIDQRPEMTDRSSLDVGKKLAWTRPLVRILQRTAKETLLAFILVGAALILILNWRDALFLLTVPFYCMAFQSLMHWEFRYTLAMHFFLFIFASVAWVILAVFLAKGIKKVKAGSFL
jgi:hypothetical protein